MLQIEGKIGEWYGLSNSLEILCKIIDPINLTILFRWFHRNKYHFKFIRTVLIKPY